MSPSFTRSRKWTSPLLYLFALLVAVVSSRYGVIWISHPHQAWIELDTGAVHVGWVSHSAAFAPSGIELLPTTGWNWSGWWPRITSPSPGGGYVALPVWMLALPLIVPTIIRMFRTAHRSTMKCYACSYNLTGNISGVCSECGNQTAHVTSVAEK